MHAKYRRLCWACNIPSGSGQQDGETVLDIVANHPGTARAVCRKLCRRLIADNPPESVVQAAAISSMPSATRPIKLKQVVALILRSAEFRFLPGSRRLSAPSSTR